MSRYAETLAAHRERLREAHMLRQRLEAAIQPVTEEQLFAMHHLAEHGPTPLTHLANAAGMSSGGMTKAFDRLARRDWVVRNHDAQDRRVIWAVLTDEGRAFYELALANYVAVLDAS